jgi:RES domain-containing protein
MTGAGGPRALPLDRVARAPARPYRGTVYRVIGSRYLRSPLASAGALRTGGRFNAPHAFEVLYTALSPDTALAERDGLLLTTAGIKAARAVRTGVLLHIECRLTRVLDLCDGRVRGPLGIALADLLGPWIPWNTPAPASEAMSDARQPALAPSQHIGNVVRQSRRFEAILSPSAKDPTGRCLAIFPDRLQLGSSIRIDDRDGVIRGALGLPK